jgi:hypothetical protein
MLVWHCTCCIVFLEATSIVTFRHANAESTSNQAVKQLDDGSMVGDDFNVFSIPSKEP